MKSELFGDVLDVELITLGMKIIVFMRFSSNSSNLLEISRIISFVFDFDLKSDAKYLTKNGGTLHVG